MNKIIVGMGKPTLGCCPKERKIGGAPANFCLSCNHSLVLIAV